MSKAKNASRTVPAKTPAGFTLIEIVLVLAIAGLLFVIIFAAVAGAQRSRRDFQRKNDVAALAANGIDWSAAHDQRVANTQTEVDDIAVHYFLSRNDPSSGTPYIVEHRAVGSPHERVPDVGTINYQIGHWCNRGPDADLTHPDYPIAGNDSQLSKFVVWTQLETGGTTCADNK